MTTLFAAAFARFEPRSQVSSLEWFKENVSTPEGNAYDHDSFPHIGAPGGPCDALDEPSILTIWMQWGSRLGKTFFGQASTLFYADRFHCPMMFAGASEKLAVEVTERTCRMIEHCPRLHMIKKRQHQLDFKTCRMFVGWARSVSTLADKAVRLGHGSELDKWEQPSTSTEADPLKLFQDRGKEFPARKFIFESTPTVKGRSRIERGRLASTNCRYWVPCPHCKTYQFLEMGKENDRHGIKWDKNEAGKSDKELARTSAHYVCAHCGEKIKDEHRAGMMRRGVWVPEGCGVDSQKAASVVARLTQARGSDGAATGDDLPTWRGWLHAEWITGTPTHLGRDAGYHLSSLYALQLGWGDIAAEFVESKEKAQNLRNFINQWLAETWEIKASKTTWQQLGERIIDTSLRRETVPDWASLITVGVDLQQEYCVFTVEAWGPGAQNHTVHYGLCENLRAVREEAISRNYKYADGRGHLTPSFTLIDTGFRSLGVYEFCKECHRVPLQVWPCKGSSTALDSDYRIKVLDNKSGSPGMKLVHVDTLRTQGWIEQMLHVVRKTEAGAYSLFAGSLYDHQDFLEQLLNDVAILDDDKTHEYWERVEMGAPNDFRDCRRYGYTAMLIAMRGKPVPGRPGVKPRKEEKDKPEPKVQFLERPGGWLNVR